MPIIIDIHILHKTQSVSFGFRWCEKSNAPDTKKGCALGRKILLPPANGSKECVAGGN